MAGTLYVVATPIGHLDDITLRALRILREVSLVAAEDTRRSGQLLRHYDIHTPMVSVHEHNERARAPRLVDRLAAGESIALVTDAGTPAISDPGSLVVAEARARGIRIEAVPGPSAVMAALSIAGLPASAFTFLGFPPIRSKNRAAWFQSIGTATDLAIVLFEAPHRVIATLRELSNCVNCPIIVARELTKIHEEVLTGYAKEVSLRLGHPRGEFTIVIPPRDRPQKANGTLDLARLAAEIGVITKNGRARSKREAARLIAERMGVSTRQVYDAMDRQGESSE